MAKKQKKSLKASQKRFRYRLGEKLTFLGEIISIVTPYLIMSIVNFEEWFKTTDGWKVGLGLILSIIAVFLALTPITKRVDNKNSITGGYIQFGASWIVVIAIIFLLDKLMKDIIAIMSFGLIGIVCAFCCRIACFKFKEKADLYTEAIKEFEKDTAKEEAREDARKEFQQEEIERRPTE